MTSPRAAETSVLPGAGRYRIDPARSEVTFRTRHMFGLGGVTGTFAVRSGEVVVTPSPDGSTVTAVIDSGSFRTDNPRRDKDVRSARFLRTDEHPEIVFQGAGARRDGTGWVLPGHLTVCGQSRSVDLTVVELRGADGTLTARATTRADRYSFGITAAKGLAARHLDLEIVLVAALQDEAG